MDKDRIEGSLKQASGAIKEGAGKVLGDQKLKAEGAAEKLGGKIQNAVGGVKDAVRQTHDEAEDERKHASNR
ncbi:MAG TPA: CsbD family protein [Alphaproteobacteria bacterium]|nr:CsbD family protein [Alphaproteobacteria bacterium]